MRRRIRAGLAGILILSSSTALAVVDVAYNTAYTLSTRQTPILDCPDETRLDWYLSHLAQDRHALQTHRDRFSLS